MSESIAACCPQMGASILSSRISLDFATGYSVGRAFMKGGKYHEHAQRMTNVVGFCALIEGSRSDGQDGKR